LNKYIIAFIICIILIAIASTWEYFNTKKLKKHMIYEKEKALLYRDLTILMNSYYKVLIINNALEFRFLERRALEYCYDEAFKRAFENLHGNIKSELSC